MSIARDLNQYDKEQLMEFIRHLENKNQNLDQQELINQNRILQAENNELRNLLANNRPLWKELLTDPKFYIAMALSAVTFFLLSGAIGLAFFVAKCAVGAGIFLATIYAASEICVRMQQREGQRGPITWGQRARALLNLGGQALYHLGSSFLVEPMKTAGEVLNEAKKSIATYWHSLWSKSKENQPQVQPEAMEACYENAKAPSPIQMHPNYLDPFNPGACFDSQDNLLGTTAQLHQHFNVSSVNAATTSSVAVNDDQQPQSVASLLSQARYNHVNRDKQPSVSSLNYPDAAEVKMQLK